MIQKKSYTQKTLKAYDSKQYSSILKAAHTFAIPESTMKNCISGKVSQTIAQELQTRKKRIIMTDYTSYNHYISCFSKAGAENGLRNLSRLLVSCTSSFI